MDGILNDKSFLRKIFNHATSIIIVLDEYKNIIDFNSTALKYLGISINNLTEMSFSNIVLEDDKDRINKCIDGIFDNTFQPPLYWRSRSPWVFPSDLRQQDHAALFR